MGDSNQVSGDQSPVFFGSITSRNGDVRHQKLDQSAESEEDSSVFEDEAIETGPESGTSVAIKGGGNIVLDENTRLVFSHSGNGEDPAEIRLSEGRIIISGGISNKSVMVKTGEAAVSTSGEKVLLEQASGKIRVAVFKGSAGVTAQGKEIQVQENQAVTVSPGNPPDIPVEMPSAPQQIRIRSH